VGECGTGKVVRRLRQTLLLSIPTLNSSFALTMVNSTLPLVNLTVCVDVSSLGQRNKNASITVDTTNLMELTATPGHVAILLTNSTMMTMENNNRHFVQNLHMYQLYFLHFRLCSIMSRKIRKFLYLKTNAKIFKKVNFGNLD